MAIPTRSSCGAALRASALPSPPVHLGEHQQDAHERAAQRESARIDSPNRDQLLLSDLKYVSYSSQKVADGSGQTIKLARRGPPPRAARSQCILKSRVCRFPTRQNVAVNLHQPESVIAQYCSIAAVCASDDRPSCCLHVRRDADVTNRRRPLAFPFVMSPRGIPLWKCLRALHRPLLPSPVCRAMSFGMGAV